MRVDKRRKVTVVPSSIVKSSRSTRADSATCLLAVASQPSPVLRTAMQSSRDTTDMPRAAIGRNGTTRKKQVEDVGSRMTRATYGNSANKGLERQTPPLRMTRSRTREMEHGKVNGTQLPVFKHPDALP